MRLLPLIVASIALLFAATPAAACRIPSLSVQMVFDAEPGSVPDGALVIRGRFTNQGPLFEQAFGAEPFLDMPGSFDAALIAVVDTGNGPAVRVYEVAITSCNGLFGRDRVFDFDGWVVGRPITTDDGSPAIDPLGRHPSGEWTEF